MAERFTAQQHEGDGVFSWAVFDNGQVITSLSGLSRSMARYHVRACKAQSEQEQAAKQVRTCNICRAKHGQPHLKTCPNKARKEAR